MAEYYNYDIPMTRKGKLLLKTGNSYKIVRECTLKSFISAYGEPKRHKLYGPYEPMFVNGREVYSCDNFYIVKKGGKEYWFWFVSLQNPLTNRINLAIPNNKNSMFYQRKFAR